MSTSPGNRWLSGGRSVSRAVANRIVLVAAIALVVACGCVAAAAYGYDRSQSDVIAKGVTVGGIDIGGMTASAARARLARAYKPLRRPVILVYKHGRLVLTGREAEVRVDVDRLVREAVAESRDGWFLSRAWRDLTGGTVQTQLRPHVRYSRSAIRSAVARLRSRIDEQPVDAKVLPSFNSLVVHGGHNGIEVKGSLLRWRITHALVSRHSARRIPVPTRVLKPEVTIAKLQHQFPSYITIDRGNFTLRLYDRLRFVKSYPIAVGQAGLETPEGLYHIQDKQIDPSWHVPNSAWAGSLAGQVIPPGPDDPLKARWMGLWNGAGIHGTDETWSIGHAVSHGCVRMLIPDVIDLYDRVNVGTPVYIGD